MPPAAAVPSVKTILAELKSKGTEKNRVTYARHGHALDQTYGVSVADLKLIAKSIKGQQALALELYASGMMEAMYLAGIVANGAKMSEAQLHAWAEGATGLTMISEHTVAWVTVENPSARSLAQQWIASGKEYVASSGWCTFAGLVAITPDDALDFAELRTLLDTAVKTVHAAPNRARATMNGFVISVGSYVEPLLQDAKAAAKKIGPVSIDVGDTACEVRQSGQYIEKIESMGRVGRKRKTIRC